MRADDLPAAPSDRETLATLCDRESRLDGCALLIECDHDADGPPLRPVIALAERLEAPLLIAARDPVRLRGRPTVRLDVNRGDAREQRDLAGAVGPAADRLDGQLDGLAAQFHLDAESIQSVGARSSPRSPSAPTCWGPGSGTPAAAGPSRGWTAWPSGSSRPPPGTTWSCPSLCSTSCARSPCTSASGPRSTAPGASPARVARAGHQRLFAGASGTGKTLAAEVIARELRLDLYRIDLSQVVSKYIGDTEKNLRRVFDAAEEGAPSSSSTRPTPSSASGRRSRTATTATPTSRSATCSSGWSATAAWRSSRPTSRTTWTRRSCGGSGSWSSFRSPTPQRAEIWRRIFPDDTPRDGLDYDRLSRLNVPGGNIRNIALHAAFHAAESGEPVKMDHIRRAAETEFTKLERSWSEEILKAP